jgi:endonuclease YncB( thermonuclease family)
MLGQKMPVAAVSASPVRRGSGLWLGLCLLFWGGLALAAPGAIWSGRVTHVTDGDTLWVQPLQGGEVRRIRMDGIDAPEICQVYGEAARRALTERVQGRQVVVQGRRKDDYGRLLARIYVQDEDVGQWMVLAGHAWSYRHQRSVGPYAAQETQAREQGLGLWQGRAMPPRTFRRRHGSCH